MKWEKNKNKSNYILEHPKQKFYISYQPAGGDLNYGYGFMGESNGETALVKCLSGRKKISGKFRPNRRFYILNGDWRKEYEKIIGKGYVACKKFYDKKLKEGCGNFWRSPQPLK